METIQGAFERQVARSPQSAAVIEGADRSQRLSYSELSNASKQVRQAPRHSHVPIHFTSPLASFCAQLKTLSFEPRLWPWGLGLGLGLGLAC